jgi:hypothetical protein
MPQPPRRHRPTGAELAVARLALVVAVVLGVALLWHAVADLTTPTPQAVFAGAIESTVMIDSTCEYSITREHVCWKLTCRGFVVNVPRLHPGGFTRMYEEGAENWGYFSPTFNLTVHPVFDTRSPPTDRIEIMYKLYRECAAQMPQRRVFFD